MKTIKDWLLGWKLFLGIRSLPTTQADAIFIPGLTLNKDKTRLTYANRDAVLEAIRLWKNRFVKKIIYSSNISQELAELEASLRTYLFINSCVKANDLVPLTQPWNSQTQDEVEGLRRMLKTYPEIKSIIVVTDNWQMPRLVYAMQQMIPRIKIYPAPIKFSRLERSYEQGAKFGSIKTLLFSNKLLWGIRNVLMYFLTPILIRKWTKPLRHSR